MKDGLPYLEYLDDDTTEGVTSQLIGKMRMPRVRVKYPAKPELEGFDMYLTTGKPSAAQFGDGTHWAWNLHEQTPDQYCLIHSEKASEIGVRQGDTVRITGLKGEFMAKAWIYEGIRKDTLFVPNSYSHAQPYSQWESVNSIVDKDKRCPISDQTNYKGLVCRVSKA
jgi:anaerobic selenocysteine-containing dehydrogenase